jgi:transposase-like protein
VVHANAPLTQRHRLRLAKLIVEDGLPIVQAAQRFQISWPTAKRWADRYRAEGEAGMTDRSSRPHHSPRKTQQARPARSYATGCVYDSGRWRSAPDRACRPQRCTVC